MTDYKKILVALDFSDHADRVLARAVRLARDHGAALHLAHVLEYLSPMLVADEPFPSSIWMIDEEQLLVNARERMKSFAASISGLSVTEHAVVGAPRQELCNTAEEEGVDLMVARSPGPHGIARMLGSTAAGPAHHAPGDLWRVRIADSYACLSVG